MRLVKPRLPKGSQEYETYMEVEGVELDITVIYSVQPPEPDVNVAGGIEIEGVYLKDKDDLDITALCTEVELEQFANDINDNLVSAWEGAAEDYYG